MTVFHATQLLDSNKIYHSISTNLFTHKRIHTNCTQLFQTFIFWSGWTNPFHTYLSKLQMYRCKPLLWSKWVASWIGSWLYVTHYWSSLNHFECWFETCNCTKWSPRRPHVIMHSSTRTLNICLLLVWAFSAQFEVIQGIYLIHLYCCITTSKWW